MTTRKVQNPNSKGGSAFIWAVAAVIAIAALVIGLIIFNGNNERNEAREAAKADMSGITVEWAEGEGVIHLKGANVDAPTGQLFEDFACGHCATLHMTTDADMLQALRDGSINVELRPMVFQDRGAVGHSTNSLAAVLALINHGDIDTAFTLRDYLFVNQQQVYNTMNPDKLADLAKDYGASEEAVADIRESTFVEAAQSMGADNIQLQQDETGEAWTPRVRFDGEDIEGVSEEGTTWVEVLSESK
ncbi:thioredoxin domain-containing protein [Corynebacterium sp. HMSC29G08]|uniref:DsbA family protein n=1 Tax=Corynebacterium sp. HMSC29G08 TaxID=1581069 RepID=UPI0008A0FE18|nr:thioredoxin domain-containing protein [Corynebacterium sp. HMSC29G08]OFT81072.1 hypothetical protein HMPREF3101_11115 [Corynebacterium sp. HMSC29G08]